MTFVPHTWEAFLTHSRSITRAAGFQGSPEERGCSWGVQAVMLVPLQFGSLDVAERVA